MKPSNSRCTTSFRKGRVTSAISKHSVAKTPCHIKDLRRSLRATSSTNSDSSDKFSDREMLLHRKSCFLNYPLDKLHVIHITTSNDSSEETCTIHTRRRMLQSKLTQTSMEESKTVPYNEASDKKVSPQRPSLGSTDQEGNVPDKFTYLQKGRGRAPVHAIDFMMQIRQGRFIPSFIIG